MTQHVLEATDETFQSAVLDGDLPVIVDFWAEWCGPCKMIAPILEETAKEMQGKVKFFKMNVDNNEKMPAHYGVRGIPTLIIFKNGEVEARSVGALSKSELINFINENAL